MHQQFCLRITEASSDQAIGRIAVDVIDPFIFIGAGALDAAAVNLVPAVAGASATIAAKINIDRGKFNARKSIAVAGFRREEAVSKT